MQVWEGGYGWEEGEEEAVPFSPGAVEGLKGRKREREREERGQFNELCFHTFQGKDLLLDTIMCTAKSFGSGK